MKKMFLYMGEQGSIVQQFKDLQLKESKRILSLSEDQSNQINQWKELIP